ncbi:MAG: bifunctional 5,10-methylenetetrahydrofolate dehydrogenase/5,10-methenyltetrahydrofolate cyclohydrolase [Rickettsiaceae bacterium]
MTQEGAVLIDGKKISESILTDLKGKISESHQLGIPAATLAIILIGDDAASKIYVSNKTRAALKIGIKTKLYKFDSTISEFSLLQHIALLNQDITISGIIVQLPIPNHIDKLKIITAIDPNKDVDGFHPINIGLLYSPYENGFVPCTARGCLSLIRSCIPNLVGKHAVIIGRSNIVGRPLAALLLKEDCTITICHSKTRNLAQITSNSDIVVSAIGSPKFLTKEYFNPKSVVLDVGINRYSDNNKSILVGDVDFHSVKNYVGYITPVPGGVGPMTVAYLLVNTYIAQQKFLNSKN